MKDFNTSNVTILHMLVNGEFMEVEISIHLMLLFYPLPPDLPVSGLLISIHLMLLFYGTLKMYFVPLGSHFNTSNVTILPR